MFIVSGRIISSVIDCNRLLVSSNVSPHALNRSSVPSMKPINRQKWLNASNCSRLPTTPNSSGIKTTKPMKRYCVIAMSFWEIMPAPALVDLLLITTCIRRTVSRDFQALKCFCLISKKLKSSTHSKPYIVPGLIWFLYHNIAWSPFALKRL